MHNNHSGAMKEKSSTQEVVDGSDIMELVENERVFGKFVDHKFQELDGDGDGKLSVKELQPAVADIGAALGLPAQGTSTDSDHIYSEKKEILPRNRLASRTADPNPSERLFNDCWNVSNISYNFVNWLCTPMDDLSAPVYITIGDGGNLEGLATNMTEPLPKYSAFREASFGNATFDIKNKTHAYYSWHRNQDGYAVQADSTWFFNRY